MTGRVKAKKNASARARLNYLDQPGDRLPSQLVGALGVVGFIVGWIVFARWGQMITLGQGICLFLFFTASPMVLANLFFNRVHLRRTAGLCGQRPTLNVRRCSIKLLGVSATLICLATFYWAFPEYGKPFYDPAWETLSFLLPCLAPFIITYFCWADSRMRNPEDGYYFCGLLVLGRWREIDWPEIRFYGRTWIMKGFFTPFMFAALGERIGHLPETCDFGNFLSLYYTASGLFYSVDVAFGTLGYLLTTRALDGHIRSTESTWLGWISALSCYTPFSLFVQQSFISYKGEINWAQWLLDHSFFLVN